jgi:hypothetical protein
MKAELFYQNEDLFQNVVLDLAWLIHDLEGGGPFVTWEVQEEAADYVIKNGIQAGLDRLVRGGFRA